MARGGKQKTERAPVQKAEGDDAKKKALDMALSTIEKQFGKATTRRRHPEGRRVVAELQTRGPQLVIRWGLPKPVQKKLKPVLRLHPSHEGRGSSQSRLTKPDWGASSAFRPPLSPILTVPPTA